MTKVQGFMRAMRLVESANELPAFIREAEKQQLSYTQFLLQVMEYEKKRREEKVIEKHLKWPTSLSNKPWTLFRWLTNRPLKQSSSIN